MADHLKRMIVPTFYAPMLIVQFYRVLCFKLPLYVKRRKSTRVFIYYNQELFTLGNAIIKST